MLRRNKIALAIFVATVVILLSLQTPILRKVRGTAWDLWVTTLARVFRISSANIDNDLANQLQTLTAENVRLKSEQSDYIRLREQLGTPAFASFRSIPASITARPLDTYHVEFVLNQGAQHGLTLGAPVVIYGSTLIGFITELHNQSARVQLLLHPATNVTAEVITESNPRGLLTGQHYTSLLLSTIPRDANLAAGQDVVTIAREGLPHGLLIGKINRIEREEDEAYQKAIVALPYDPDYLEAVIVLVEP
ncbi:MAG: rod shape-determining protein MreC [Candidatus Andersenbacteria bacterium]